MTAPKKPKRINVFPGAAFTVAPGKQLHLDAHFLLWGVSKMAPSGTAITVVSGPKKSKDGINLVRVDLKTGDGRTYDCFYCDILANCLVELCTYLLLQQSLLVSPVGSFQNLAGTLSLPP